MVIQIRIMGIIFVLLLPWIFVFPAEAASVGGGLEITEQRHSAFTPLTISLLDVLEERFPVRAGRASSVGDLGKIRQNNSPSLGIQPRKLSFSHDLEEVENLLGRTENEGREDPRDQEKITYDHHQSRPSSSEDVEKEEFGFEVEPSQLGLPIPAVVVQKNVEGAAKVRNESQSRESLNLSSWAEEGVKVTSERATTSSLKLVFQKGSTSTTGQGDAGIRTTNTTSQSFIYPSLIRPTPTPPQVFKATSPRTQIVQNSTEAENAVQTKNHLTSPSPKFTTQLADISNVAFSNNTNSLNRTMGEDHLQNHHLVLGNTDLLETFVRDILFPDTDVLDLGLFSEEKTGKLPLSNATTRTDFPLWHTLNSPKPKSTALMSTLAVTGIFLISILMLFAFLSHVLFSTPVASTRADELFPSSVSNSFHPMTLAWGEFPQFKEPTTSHFFLHERRNGGESTKDGISIINSSSSFLFPTFPFHHFHLQRK